MKFIIFNAFIAITKEALDRFQKNSSKCSQMFRFSGSTIGVAVQLLDYQAFTPPPTT
ncbi:MAG: hypothetical protein LBR36_09695 [Bacteroidales bacterium]|jgi:hypothetical protein|nr:hypothetical protein [Bacteroidales bacterium]